ncbi:MAG TPA: hypothetical protein VH352_20185 [Pseudonocardiaceae bacterium]|jgi:hypothetical protein|nr:hypothetical protein [Pseudonocardiaceae bacterium]
MTGYHLDQQVLRDSARALDQAAESLREGASALHDEPRIDLGTDELNATAADLLQGAVTTLDHTTADVTDTATGLRDSLAGYADTEQRIIDTLRDTS